MTAIATAFVEIQADASKGEQQTKDAARRMGDSATKTLAQVFSAAIVVREFSKIIGAASRLEQAVGGTEAIFGRASVTIDKYAKNAAQAAGIAEASYRELSTRIGGILQGMKFTQEESAATSVKLVQLGADLAATFGGKPEEAVVALGAALRGEYDPLERFGVSLRMREVNLRAVELGLAKSTTAVDSHARGVAALDLIYANSQGAQGQFARESDQAANKVQRMTAEFENARAALGTQLLPMFVKAVEILGLLIDGFAALPGPVQIAILALIAVAALAGPLMKLVTTVQLLGSTIMRANPWLLALSAAAVVVTTVVTTMGSRVTDSEKRIDAMADAMNSAGDAATGLSKYLLDAVKGNDLLLASLDGAGVTLDDLAKATLEGGDAWDEMNLAIARASTKILSTKQEREDLRIFFETLPAEAAASTAAMEQLNRVADLPAMNEGTAAAAEFAATQAELVAVTIDSASAFDALDSAVDALTSSFDDVIGRSSDLSAATDELFNKALELTKSVKDNGTSLDVWTEKGLANRAAIREQTDAIMNQAAALVANGGSMDEAALAVENHRQNLIEQAKQLGFNEEEINAYLTELGLTPENISTSIELAGDRAARDRIDALIDQIGKIPEEKATQIQSLIDAGRLAEAERALNNLARTRVAGYVPEGFRSSIPGTRSAAGRYVDRYMVSSLGEEGPEAVLPLTKPSRLAELLADERIGGPVREALGSSGSSVPGGRSSTVTIGAIYTQQPAGVRDELEYLMWESGAR